MWPWLLWRFREWEVRPPGSPGHRVLCICCLISLSEPHWEEGVLRLISQERNGGSERFHNIPEGQLISSGAGRRSHISAAEPPCCDRSYWDTPQTEYAKKGLCFFGCWYIQDWAKFNAVVGVTWWWGCGHHCMTARRELGKMGKAKQKAELTGPENIFK